MVCQNARARGQVERRKKTEVVGVGVGVGAGVVTNTVAGIAVIIVAVHLYSTSDLPSVHAEEQQPPPLCVYPGSLCPNTSAAWPPFGYTTTKPCSSATLSMSERPTCVICRGGGKREQWLSERERERERRFYLIT